MELSLVFALISALIYLSGFIHYIYHVYHGRVCPHPFSWSIWAIISLINSIALIGTVDSFFPILSSFFRTSCLIMGGVIGWTIIRKIRINIFDYTCLSLAIFTLGIAYFYGVENAIILTILIDLLVFSPTLKKIWITPDSEDLTAWITATISHFFLLLSIGTFSLKVGLFWTYSMSMNILIVVFIMLRIRYIRSWHYKLRKLLSFFALDNKL